MANSADPDQLAFSEMIWICTVCNGKIYLGLAGLGFDTGTWGVLNQNQKFYWWYV